MPPTRERPGLVPVLVHDRRRWYVVDPALTPDAAADAVAELRRSAAPTNVGSGRRVLRWAPLTVFVVTLAIGGVAVVVGVEALPLTEEFGAVSLGVAGLLAVLVGAIALAFSVADRLAPDLVGPAPSAQVVPVPRHVLSWLRDDTAAEAVWRVTAAVGLVEELRGARWAVADADGQELEDDRGDEGPGGEAVARRAVAVLVAAEATAVDELRAVAAATGYVPSRRHAEVDR
ncbi:hypothetical protein ASF82_00175 [Frigoribacterium sp. Leaf164]|uniref:hypothetical protein n=1 Tax=Frigoribacterium sp. Leaf164 TaxID=1736282 RepID=UPI0006F9510F|nr:hypothetical protein [Frigoribacterium sp. Leaf164]KQR46024.1 hypothetical protein ASF82_00175 [Frigoribacterium sp. Leaf164]